MKQRYSMKSSSGEYVEHTEKSVLIDIRKTNPIFKYARIASSLQTWDDVILIGTIYPPEIESRAEFFRFNHQKDA